MPGMGLRISLARPGFSNHSLKRDGAYSSGYFKGTSLCSPPHTEHAYQVRDLVDTWYVYNKFGQSTIAHGKYDDGSSVVYVFERGKRLDPAKHEPGPFSDGYYNIKGDIDITVTVTEKDLDTDTIRYYVDGIPADGSFIDDKTEDNLPHDFIQGIKGFVTKGTTIQKDIINYVDIGVTKNCKNGTHSINADGEGGVYKVYKYLSKGDVVYDDSILSHISDGKGGLYTVHNSGAYSDGYYEGGMISKPPTSNVYKLIDTPNTFVLYKEDGNFKKKANGLLLLTNDEKHHYFSSGKDDGVVDGAVDVDNKGVYIEYTQGLKIGKANGYFTNGYFVDGDYNYNDPSYTPIIPKDSKDTYYVYHWSGMPGFHRPADGVYSIGFFDYGIVNTTYSNPTPQKAHDDLNYYTYENGVPCEADYSQANLTTLFYSKVKYPEGVNGSNYRVCKLVGQYNGKSLYELEDESVYWNSNSKCWVMDRGNETINISLEPTNPQYPWNVTRWVDSIQQPMVGVTAEPIWN